jgi:predicted alpha/beta hydrolase
MLLDRSVQTEEAAMNAPQMRVNGAELVLGEEPVEIASHCATLQGRLFRPSGPATAAIVLHGATGVPQRFYRAFAAWLAEEGYACLTYDYRDFGASAIAHPRLSAATLSDWGIRDQAAAQRRLEQLVPGIPIWVVGHSLGGFMLPFHEGAGRVARLITVASAPVHVSDHPLPQRIIVGAFWSAPVSGLTRALGYLPGRLLRLGHDLPPGVYAEWRRWCTTRGFYLGDIEQSLPMPDWAALKAPAKFVAVADDGLATPAAVWRLMQHYPEAIKRQLVLRPADFGLKRIGHIGAFAARNRAVWPAIMA